MNRGRRRLFCILLLAGMMLLPGCSDGEEKGAHQVQTVPKETMGRAPEDGTQPEQKALRLYPGETSQGLSPFFYMTSGDERVLNLLYQKVCPDGGGDGAAAQIKVIRKQKSRRTVYRVTVREGLRDGEGNVITSDDLMFNYALRCRLDYKGMDQVNRLDIVGLDRYWYGVSGKRLRARKKRVRERMSYPTREIAGKLRREIILPALRREYAWVESIYLDGDQTNLIKKYPQASLLFSRYFAPDTDYTGKGKSKRQVLRDVARQYGGDIKKLSRVTGEDYTAEAEGLIIRHLWKKQKTGKGKIAGIRKRDSRTVEIVTEGFRRADRSRLGNLYLLSKHMFTSAGTDTTLPPGCGRYCLEKQTEEGVWLVANRCYPGEAAGIDRIQIMPNAAGKGEDVAVECIKKIADGEMDMAVVWERISKEREALRKALEEGDASWKVAANGGVLYSADRINATTMPHKMTPADDVLSKIEQLKMN